MTKVLDKNAFEVAGFGVRSNEVFVYSQQVKCYKSVNYDLILITQVSSSNWQMV